MGKVKTYYRGVGYILAVFGVIFFIAVICQIEQFQRFMGAHFVESLSVLSGILFICAVQVALLWSISLPQRKWWHIRKEYLLTWLIIILTFTILAIIARVISN